MINYDQYYAYFKFLFIKPVIYENNEVLGKILNSEIKIEILLFLRDTEEFLKRPEYQAEFLISLCDLNQTITEFIKILTKLNNPKVSGSITNQTPFISVNGDQDDLGIWFSFSCVEDYIYIKIDFRTMDSLFLK